MFNLGDVEYVRNKLNEKTAKVNGTLAGALGGAGLGLLTQAIRPKDRDQNKLKEYILSAILGAGLGAAGGFAYDTAKGHKKSRHGKHSGESDGGKGSDEKGKSKVKPLDEYDSRKSNEERALEAARMKHQEAALKRWEESGRDPNARSAGFRVAVPSPELLAEIERRLELKSKTTGEPLKNRFATLEQIENDNRDIFGKNGRPVPGRGIILSRQMFDRMYPGDDSVDRDMREKLEPYVWDGIPGIRPTPLWWKINSSGQEEIWPTAVTSEGYVVPLDMSFNGKQLEPVYRSVFGDTGSVGNRIATSTVEGAKQVVDYLGLSDVHNKLKTPPNKQ